MATRKGVLGLGDVWVMSGGVWGVSGRCFGGVWGVSTGSGAAWLNCSGVWMLSGSDRWCLGGVWVASGGCLEVVWGCLGGFWEVSGGFWWCLGGVGWCLDGVWDTFSNPGTLCPPRDIQESWTPGLIGLKRLYGLKIFFYELMKHFL